jgi:hypothetical protein
MDNFEQSAQAGAMRNLVAVMLSMLLTLSSAAQDVAKRTIQEQVVQIAQGAPVEVRLTKPPEKLRGRMGEISSGGFTLQIANGNQTTPRAISFAEVKTIKTLGKTKVVTKVFVTLGVIWLVSTIIGLVVFRGKLD